MSEQNFGQRVNIRPSLLKSTTENCTWPIGCVAISFELVCVCFSLRESKMPKVKAAKKSREHGQNKVYQQGTYDV